ncbi:mitogen-activated protein kinase kinase kinase 1-like [Patiria miniata]|uniref:Mitogen-activated protein kinase kinase kinase 1 n=1 Tax=Patiria miniata TaxID=46514 RepID=A0A914BIN3_PATMI|nr:mitogen-activated protein kinase kinase kinase 1-like [Patiria miniata]
METRGARSKRGISSRDPSPELSKSRPRTKRDQSPKSCSGDNGARAAPCAGQSVASSGEVNKPVGAGPGAGGGGGGGCSNLNGMIEKDKWMAKMEDPLEKQRIRERLRAMPSGKKDGEEKQRGRGPMVVRPPSPSSRQISSGASSGSKVDVAKRPSTLRTKRSPSPRQTPESVFAQQVVCRSGSPTSPRIARHRSRISPVNSRPPSPPFSSLKRSPSPSLKRSPSPQGEISIAIAEEILQKRVERALHARLYLLQQSGPNSFVIGGDSPSHKYKVTIGPQNCNCTKGPFCLHVLFVMLRVLQVPEGDPILWSRTLMNYEVEALFKNYQARQKKRLKRSSKSTSQHERKSSHDASATTSTSTCTTSLNSTTSSDQSNKEEDLCPICLLEMVDGESLVVCQDGCRNRLHHHCVAIWAAECERQNDPLNCPLCRTKWDTPPEDGSDAPPNTRKPSPAQSPRLMRRASRQNSEAGELPQETQSWIEVFSEDLIRPLFSREWSLRESAFHQLRPAIRAKIQPHEGAVYTPEDEAVIRTCCRIIALGCSDPVYKVYVAALKGLRTMLSCIQCFNEADRHRLREELRHVVEPILFKCADGNRRTSQLSISALIELSKGQAGELAVGREVSSSDFVGLGAVEYVEECIFDSSLSFEPAWQPHLGRLCVLEKLMKEFPEEYVPSEEDGSLQAANCDHLMRVLRFALQAARNNHSRICKLGKRVFVNIARNTVHMPVMYEKVCDSLLELEADLQHGLRRRLTNILDDFEASRTVAERLQETDLHIYGRVVQDSEVSSVHDEDELLHFAGEQDVKTPERKLSDNKDPKSLAVVSEGILTPPPTPPSHNSSQSQRPTSKIPQLKQDRYASNRPHLAFKGDNRPNLSDFSPIQREAGASKTEDLSDLSLSISPCSPTDRAITFKNEIATASTLSPKHVPGGLSCKEQIEMEEAEAIVVAMETSITQNPLPIVPGLSPGKDQDVIVHIQSEDGETPREKCYVEKEHWVKGVLLGTGAFSSCYQSRDIRTGTLMAVKQVSFIRNTKCEQDKVVESLMREINLMKELDHPNLVRLLGATRHNGHFNVFVEWMAGGSISSVLSAYGAFEEPVVLKYTRQLLTGVAFLHSKHVIHRDLKGANLLLDSTGQHLRIADFGTAAQMASKVTAEGEFKGQLIGTIAFMSPEVLRGEPYGRTCDVWSIGCCMVEMATAHPPWNASAISNHLQLIFKIASAEGPPPIPDEMSTGTRDLMLRCFEHKAANRESAADLLKHAVFTRL